MVRSSFRFLLCWCVAFGLALTAAATEPFLRPHDVIALVGGEDMVVASEAGYLELLLTRALPGHQLRFRDLACEGDTVFEQRRELNFPTWEEQLDKIGATVVLCRFGQMESLGGREPLRGFIAAYEQLIARFSGEKKRRVVLIGPSPNEPAPTLGSAVIQAIGRRGGSELGAWESAIQELAQRTGAGFISTRFVARWGLTLEVGKQKGVPWKTEVPADMRDGLHLSDLGQRSFARVLGAALEEKTKALSPLLRTSNAEPLEMLTLIRAKNRLWFDYWRPQNWAFLAGDRTSQPSSRDYLDPSKRWFPPEREAFLPLIEAREKEIHALAARLVGK